MNIFKACMYLSILYFPSLEIWGNENGLLKLKNFTGAAPLTVRVTGQEFLLNTKGVCKAGFFSGDRFNINWGDGSPLPDKCDDLLQHTYTTAGHYDVAATVFHLGPTDGAITTWKGRAEVEVTSDGISSSLKTIQLSGNDFEFYRSPEILLGISAVKKGGFN